MAITRAETQVTWSSSNSVSVTSGSNQTSDAMSLNATCTGAAVTLKADNAGTPASGDYIDFYWLATAGDPDGASTEEYTTTGHAVHLARLDTNTEDPAIKTVPMPHNPYRFKMYAVSNASSNSITVSATVEEQRTA